MDFHAISNFSPIQIISIIWFFNNNKLKNLFNIKSKIKYDVNEIIIIINNITKLWKEIKLSEYKELESWNIIIFHVEIFNKNKNFIFET